MQSHPHEVVALKTKHGREVLIYHFVGGKPESLIEAGLIDAVIIEAEDGFSQLGMMRNFLSRDLGLQERNLVKYVLDGMPSDFEKNISSLADWSRFKRDEVTLVALPTQREGGHLKGLILAPYDGALSYKKFSTPGYIAHRDFMYNVTYEAISHANKMWRAKSIGITHFARAKYKAEFDSDVTRCQIEAICHFCDEHESIESITFFDDFRGNEPLKIVQSFNQMIDHGFHRVIKTHKLEHFGIDFIDLDLSAARLGSAKDVDGEPCRAGFGRYDSFV